MAYAHSCVSRPCSFKEDRIEASVENYLFMRCALVFHPEASGKHAGSSLGLRIYGNSAANLLTTYMKFLPKLHVNVYGQLAESRKCHPEFFLVSIKCNQVSLCTNPLFEQNSLLISELDVPRSHINHSSTAQCRPPACCKPMAHSCNMSFISN